MTKIKFFNEMDTEKNINDFMKDKNVTDIKLSECESNTTIIIVYKENEDD